MSSQQPQVLDAPHNFSAPRANQLDSGSTVASTEHGTGPERPGCSRMTAGRSSSTPSSVVQGDQCAEPWPEEAADNSHGLYSLHQMFDIVGAQLTHRDVRVLSFLFVDVIDEYERGGIRSGRDFLLALERQGRCDETNFRHILQLLRIITRHDLLAYVTLRKRQAGEWTPANAGEGSQGSPSSRSS